jgi:hypothetical protein
MDIFQEQLARNDFFTKEIYEEHVARRKDGYIESEVRAEFEKHIGFRKLYLMVRDGEDSTLLYTFENDLTNLYTKYKFLNEYVDSALVGKAPVFVKQH